MIFKLFIIYYFYQNLFIVWKQFRSRLLNNEFSRVTPIIDVFTDGIKVHSYAIQPFIRQSLIWNLTIMTTITSIDTIYFKETCGGKFIFNTLHLHVTLEYGLFLINIKTWVKCILFCLCLSIFIENYHCSTH